MAGFRMEGNTSGSVAEVDANHNLLVNLPKVLSQAGYGIAVFQSDPGTVTGAPTNRNGLVSYDQNLAEGLQSPLFNYAFNVANNIQDTAMWNLNFATMTVNTTGTGAIDFNHNDTLTTTTGVNIGTFRYFALLSNGGLRVSTVMTPTQNTVAAGQVMEWGLFVGSGGATSAPADGVFFRITNAGVLGAVTYGGTETTTAVFSLDGSLIANVFHLFEIVVNQRVTEFWIDKVLQASLPTPAGNATPFEEQQLPFTMACRNNGTVTGTATHWKFATVRIDQIDTNYSMPFAEAIAAAGGMGYQGQSGQTKGTTALYSNSLAPGAGAAMTNTTAALGTGLGGQFAALPTLAANTDGIVCSFQNPSPSINITPRTLVVTGVRIQSVVTTILAGGPVIYFYSLAFGHTAVSMATAESGNFTNNTAKAPRRIAIGIESIAATAAVGVTGGTGVFMQFLSPIVVNPNEFVAIVAKNVGTVTTLGVITFLVTFDCHWI